MSSKKKRIVTDAHEPNAGTDFHVLWSIQKCFQLLTFDPDGLQAITVEGIDPSDAAKVDPEGDSLLGVDLTEYYSAANFKGASKVVICQLKYSTKHSNKEWTASNISSGKKGTKGSIVDRLATTFKKLVEEFGISAVSKKTCIKLISNRQASAQLFTLHTKANELIASDVKTKTVGTLKKILPSSDIAAIDKLNKAAGLTSDLFIQFLSILDFSDCKAESRERLRSYTLSTITELGEIEANKQLSSLETLVRSKTYPEAKTKNKIIKEDILSLFNFPDLEAMFPVSTNFEILAHVVKRKQLKEIQKIITGPAGKVICIHGAGGIGKSTIAKHIESLLPEHSKTILFDCYGGGNYLDSNDKRHRHENAFLYLSNKIALQTGCPFLLNRSGNDAFYTKEFSRRIIIASDLLSKMDKTALLCIVIDAADNSVTAAEEQHEKTFVHDITKMPLPVNVRLIITSRSHRTKSLDLPSNYIDIPLLPFDFEECKEYLKNELPHRSFSENEVEEFRRLTKGVPRVMATILESVDDDLQDKITSLQPDGKNLDEVYSDQLRTAEIKSGDIKLFKHVIRHVIVLPRPVPIQHLSQTTGAPVEFIEDIIPDLSKNINIKGNLIRFNNEDFETFLRKHYPITLADYEEIAEVFKSLADCDDYCSTYLGRFLKSSGKIEELEEIVLHRRFIEHPTDPIRNREVFIERARLAMMHTISTKDHLKYVKLQLIAAEASKANGVIENLILKRPELATAFGNPETNAKLFSAQQNLYWFGRIHLRSAAVFSRMAGMLDLAKMHIRNAESWIEFRKNLPEEKLQDYDIDDYDIASGAEAILRTSGPVQAIKWLQRWRPKSSIYRCIKQLIENLLAITKAEQFQQWFDGIKVRTDVALLINQICFESGYPTPINTDFILSTFLPKLTLIRQKVKHPFWENLISLLEQTCKKVQAQEQIKHYLNLFEVSAPTTSPNFYIHSVSDRYEVQELDVFFRVTALKSVLNNETVSIETLLPPHLQSFDPSSKNKREYYDQERNKYLGYYKHLLPCYSLLAKVFANQTTKQQTEEAITSIASAYQQDWEFSHYRQYDSKYMTKFLSAKLLSLVFQVADSESFITIVQEKLPPKRGNNIDFYISMAERLSISNRMNKPVLAMLELVNEEITTNTLPASDQINYYTRAAIVGNRISVSAGKYYFDKIIDASKDVDEEAFEQIKAVHNIASQTNGLQDKKLAFEFARYVEYCSVKLKNYEHFPWDQAYSAIGQMDPISLLAIACRWDHRNVRKFQHHYPEILLSALAQEIIQPQIAAGLMPLNNAYWDDFVKTVSKILELYSKMVKPGEKAIFLKDLIFDLKVKYSDTSQRRIVSEVLQGLDKHGFGNYQLVIDFKEHCNKIDHLLSLENKDGRKEENFNILDNEPSKNKVDLTGVDATDPHSIESFFAKEETDLEDMPYNFDLYQGLDEMYHTVRPDQYIAHLEALIALPSKFLDYWAFENALEKRLTAWSIYPEVKLWKKQNFKKIVQSRFYQYVQLDYFYIESSIFKLAAWCEVDNATISQAIISTLPEHVANLSASALLKLLSITTLQFSTTERVNLLSWTIKKWTEPIKANFGDGVFDPKYFPEANVQSSLAKFMRYHLGHPDKRCRWSAAKAVVRLTNYGQHDILEILLQEQNDFDCVPFQHAPFTFYWIAAKQWLWIAIHKLSKQNPTALYKYAKVFFSEFSSNVTQHIQILHFVKLTCIEMEKSFPELYNESEKKTIRKVLTSPLSTVEKSHDKKRSKEFSKKLRFDFDFLDTVEHWYGPLGRVFQMSEYEIAELVDNLLCDQWGISAEALDQNNVPQDEYELTKHYKHDIPVVEDLQTYYEFNGMLCVAAELIKTKPLLKKPDYYDSWKDWLEDFGLVWDDFWLSDLKDPIPIEKKYWIETSTASPWQWNIQSKDFEHSIGFFDGLKKGFIVVASHSNIYYDSDHENQTVASALVDPHYAMSALKAMQSINTYDYHIPLEKNSDDDWDEEEETESETLPNEKGDGEKFNFRLIPWVQQLEKEHSGVDEFDADVPGLDKDRYLLGERFREWAKLELSEDKRLGATNGDFKNSISILENWSNQPFKPRHSEFYSNGQRLFVQTEKILQFLNDVNLALVINARMERWLSKSEFDPGLSTYNMLYLIYPNGTVRTVSKDFQLR